MCFDAKTSITTFCVGTTLNIAGAVYYKDSRFTAMAMVWQWVLLMQVFDAMAWLYPDCKSIQNKIANRGAYMANITQPIVIFLLFMLITKAGKMNKYIATVLIMAYISWALVASQSVKRKECLSPSGECPHLDYYWWSRGSQGLFYVFIGAAMFLLLVRPFAFGAVAAGYAGFTLILSMFIYSCGTPSVWCWAAAFAPLIMGISFKMIAK